MGRDGYGLDKALRTCNQLVSLTEDGLAAITSGDVDGLNELLGQRVLLIESLDLKAADLQVKEAQGDGEVASADSVRWLILERLRELQRIDSAIRAAVQERMVGVTADLVQVDRGRKALRGYAVPHPPSPPAFVDRFR